MAQLEARKDVLEAQLAQGEDVKVVMHPSMADHYRERVANLREALAKEGCQAEAAEIMRTLIDKIELTPVCRDGKATLSITLHGDLAGILGLAAKARGPLNASGAVVACGGRQNAANRVGWRRGYGCGLVILSPDLREQAAPAFDPPRVGAGEPHAFPDARGDGVVDRDAGLGLQRLDHAGAA